MKSVCGNKMPDGSSNKLLFLSEPGAGIKLRFIIILLNSPLNGRHYLDGLTCLSDGFVSAFHIVYVNIRFRSLHNLYILYLVGRKKNQTYLFPTT